MSNPPKVDRFSQLSESGRVPQPADGAVGGAAGSVSQEAVTSIRQARDSPRITWRIPTEFCSSLVRTAGLNVSSRHPISRRRPTVTLGYHGSGAGPPVGRVERDHGGRAIRVDILADIRPDGDNRRRSLSPFLRLDPIWLHRES